MTSVMPQANADDPTFSHTARVDAALYRRHVFWMEVINCSIVLSSTLLGFILTVCQPNLDPADPLDTIEPTADWAHVVFAEIPIALIFIYLVFYIQNSGHEFAFGTMFKRSPSIRAGDRFQKSIQYMQIVSAIMMVLSYWIFRDDADGSYRLISTWYALINFTKFQFRIDFIKF